jgi:predicted nuclease with RNAse H fold
MEHIGIDYGSKLAGTTVVAFAKKGQLHFAQSEKKKDADAFLRAWIAEAEPKLVFIDAPLSLPGVYTQPSQYNDYFYRAGDRKLRAMSPMFLGGLTARAMQLKAQLEQNGASVFETYPSQLAKALSLDAARYKKDKTYLAEATAHILSFIPDCTLASSPANWHQVDALLAYCSGWRYQNEQHKCYGELKEGAIIV